MRLSMRLASVSVLVGSMTMASSRGVALAAPTADQLAAAESLFKQGLESMKKQQYKEACAAFGGSNDVDPSPGTEINLALCNEKQGKLATAWGWYLTAANLADQRGQKERADIARGEAAKIEPKLHKLVINVKPPQPEGLAVTRDGAAVAVSTLGSELPVDPGDHTIEVTAKNKKPFKIVVHSTAVASVDRVEVPALEDVPVEAKPVPPPPPPAGGNEYSQPAPSDSSGTKKTVGFIVGGAGVVAAGVAIVLEIIAGSENSKSNTEKANADGVVPTPPSTTLTAQQKSDQDAYQASAVDHHSAAKNDQLGAIIIGAGALALIGTGVYLVLSSSSSKPTTGTLSRPLLVPIVTRDTQGLGLVGTF